MTIVDSDTLLDELFAESAEAIGADLVAYRNHAYRVFNLCLAMCPAEARATERPKIAIAAHYHDVGIWTDGTFDYLAPSAARALSYLERSGRDDWSAEISQMIVEHHKVRPFRAKQGHLVEAFRRADWIDVTLGVRRFGLARSLVRELRSAFPNAGFHARLIELGGRRLRSHPLNPLPMVRW
jgi:hypothetical protein